MTNSAQVLLVIEDNPADARLLREMINDQGVHNMRLIDVERMCDAEAYLTSHVVDLILLDLGLFDVRGLEAVQRAHAAAPRVPLVVLTGTDDESLAAQALKYGAQDYLIKGQIETQGLVRALRYAIERKRMEVELFAEKESAQVTLNCIADAVASTNDAGMVSFLNRVAVSMTGWSLAEAKGRPIGEVVRIEDGLTRIAIASPMQRIQGSRAPDQPPGEYVLVGRDGSETAIEDSVAAIHDLQGRTTGAVIVFRDVGASRAMALAMTHSAQHDYLTGLPNRMLLNDRVNQAIALAPRHNKKVAILFLDLDGFKHINDSLGHPVGDKLLQSVSERLVGCVRGADTVSRQGGDEFVVLLSEVEHSEDAAISALRLLKAVAEPHVIDGHELHVTASIGVSVFPEDGADDETLIKHADTAMYQAKENGRQGYRFFEPVMNARAVERQSTEESLRRALERNEFTLSYQPKINLRTGDIAGAEALIRWIHPTRGVIAPNEFIPIAEASGLIQPIGHWVLCEACRQAREWLEAGLTLPSIAVNISASEFRSKDFLEGVFDVIASTRLDPTLLELELTESVLMKHADTSGAILQTLRDKGVRLAVDDFGTGYSSLSYLRKFPIDTLKIDRSFVHQLGAAGEDSSIVVAVLNMARGLGLRVVAEGIETAEELAFLQANHCDVGQGYYFSPPLPADLFAKLLQTGIIPTMASRRMEAPTDPAFGTLGGVHYVERRSGKGDRRAVNIQA